MTSQTPEEIAADIERQRDQLADTVDALQAKLDVKTRAQDAVHGLADRSTTDSGKPRPQVVAVGVGVVVVVGLVVWRRRR